MDNERIIEILGQWNFWTKDTDTGIIRKKYLERMKKLIDTGQILGITGVRRSGKSTLMKQFIKSEIENGEDRNSFLYINFEEPALSSILSKEFLQQIFEAYKEIVKPSGIPYIFLDEVHNVPEWEKFARGVHEKGEAKIFISGSNSELFSKDFGTLLTGRWLELKVYPLDFMEFLGFRNIVLRSRVDMLSKKSVIKQSLKEYSVTGGFPLAVLREEKEEILKRYFNDIVEKDIALRYNIRETDKLSTLVNYYITNYSGLISFRRVSRFTGLSLDTVSRFSHYLGESYLTFFVPKFAFSLKEQEVNPKKVYCIDPGIINVLAFSFKMTSGKLYENMVAIALKQRGHEIFYHKKKHECDFLIKKKTRIKEAIQVCYDVNEDNMEREINGLEEAMEAYDLSEGLIITGDYEDNISRNKKKIIFRPLWKWLIDDI